MSKKKILFINGHLNAGGCERSLVDVLRHLDYNRYDVDLLLLEQYGDYINEIPEKVNIFLYSLENSYGPLREVLKRAFQRRDWFSLRFRLFLQLSFLFGDRFLRYTRGSFSKLAIEYDIIVAYRPGICTDLAACVFDGEKKISWWHHGEMLFSGKNLEHLLNSYRKMDTIVAVSNSSAALVKSSFPELEDRISVIPNMICVEELQKKANAYHVQFNSECINIVSIGRMSHEKNMTLCPLIGAALRQKGVFFHWYIIGDGEEFSEIKKRIQDLDLCDSYSMTGRVNNPYPFFMGASVLVHPSLVESQGITVLESMSLKTPTVVVSSEGVKEYIQSGVNGIVTSCNPTEIANRIIELTGDKDLCKKILKNGFETVGKYSPARSIEKIERLFDV